MYFRYFLILSFSFLIGMVSASLWRRISVRKKLLLRGGIPLVGGICIWLAFVIASSLSFILYGKLSPQIMGIIFGSLIMFGFGIIDDCYELSVIVKFLVQIIATTVLIFFDVRTHIVYIPEMLNIIITYIWVLGITNAFNHLDVTDGIAGMTAAIVSLAFFLVAFLNGDVKIAILSLTLTGAILSFLIYNFPPAKIYMGNSGSHSLGFVLAAIALVISYASLGRKIALLSPILILGFPIFDTVFLILIRIIRKKLPFKKSNDHLALRFLALGYSKKKTLLFMSIWGLFFSLYGVIVSQVSNFLGITIVVFVILVSLILTKKMLKVAIDD